MRSFISLKNVLYSAVIMTDISFPPIHNRNLPSAFSDNVPVFSYSSNQFCSGK